jgi:hypothetical protein
MSELWLCSPGRNRPAGALGDRRQLGIYGFCGQLETLHVSPSPSLLLRAGVAGADQWVHCYTSEV